MHNQEANSISSINKSDNKRVHINCKDINYASKTDNSQDSVEKPIIKKKKLNSIKSKIKNLKIKNKELKKELKINSKDENQNKSIKKNYNINFIEKFEENLKKIESEIKNYKIYHDILADESQNFSALLEKHETQKMNSFDKLNQLEKESKDLTKNVKLISQKEKEYKEKLFNNFEVDELQIKKDLNIKGLLIAKKTNLKKIKIENENKKIKIDENSIDIKNLNLDFTAGLNKISAENLLQNMKIFEKLKGLCNKKNKFCLVPQDDKNNYDLRQQEILENMRQLKNETAVILGKLRSKQK